MSLSGNFILEFNVCTAEKSAIATVVLPLRIIEFHLELSFRHFWSVARKPKEEAAMIALPRRRKPSRPVRSSASWRREASTFIFRRTRIDYQWLSTNVMLDSAMQIYFIFDQSIFVYRNIWLYKSNKDIWRASSFLSKKHRISFFCYLIRKPIWSA